LERVEDEVPVDIRPDREARRILGDVRLVETGRHPRNAPGGSANREQHVAFPESRSSILFVEFRRSQQNISLVDRAVLDVFHFDHRHSALVPLPRHKNAITNRSSNLDASIEIDHLPLLRHLSDLRLLEPRVTPWQATGKKFGHHGLLDKL
jgi:hypothetical protein